MVHGEPPSSLLQFFSDILEQNDDVLFWHPWLQKGVKGGGGGGHVFLLEVPDYKSTMLINLYIYIY